GAEDVRYPSRDPMEQDNLPAWSGKPGRYEVWFLTMSDGRRGYWIRSTLHARDGRPGEARLWFARFDREDPQSTFGVNRPFSLEDFRAEPGGFEVHVGGSIMRSGHSQGAISGGGHDVSWILDFETGGETYRLLPDALY